MENRIAVSIFPLGCIRSHRMAGERVTHFMIGIVILFCKNDLVRRIGRLDHIKCRIEVVATSICLDQRMLAAFDHLQSHLGCFCIIFVSTVKRSACSLQINLCQQCLCHRKSSIATIIIERLIRQSIIVHDIKQILFNQAVNFSSRNTFFKDTVRRGVRFGNVRHITKLLYQPEISISAEEFTLSHIVLDGFRTQYVRHIRHIGKYEVCTRDSFIELMPVAPSLIVE